MKLDANKILSSFRLSTRFMYNFKTFDGPFASTFETVIFWLLWVLTFFIRRHKSLLLLYMVLLPILQSCQYIWNCNILTFMSMSCEHGVDIPMKNNLFCWGEHDEIKALHFSPILLLLHLASPHCFYSCIVPCDACTCGPWCFSGRWSTKHNRASYF